MSNSGGLYTWSRTAANNASFDNTVDFRENQAPSTLNDSCRALMASAARYRDDVSGSIITGGTSAAYTVSSFQQFASAADMNGQLISFSPHITNAAGPVTLTVDGVANIPVRSSPGVELLAGTLIQGSPYSALYNNTDGALYLQGFYNDPYNVPFLGGMDYWDTITPSGAFIFPMGQNISRIVYARAFARWGTKYGVGDGTTTFGTPDKTGRVSAMIEASATRLSSLGNTTLLGIVGGEQTHTLLAAEIPAHTHSGRTGDDSPDHTHAYTQNGGLAIASGTTAGSVLMDNPFAGQSGGASARHQHNFTTDAGTGGSGAHNNLPPIITTNYIIRIS